jgi:hypothetical protein
MMQLLSLRRTWALLILGWLLISPNTFAANSQADWMAECVGRYQLNIPGEVEVALTTEEGFLTTDLAVHIGFKNGLAAPYSRFIYRGEIDISTTMKSEEVALLQKKIDAKVNTLKKYYIENYREDVAQSIKPITLASPTAFSWQAGVVVHQYIYQDNRIFGFIAGEQDSLIENLKLSHLIVDNLHPRPLFVLPKGEGICIPYGFISDDGKPARHVAVTMRLIDHPDVEIFFEDQTAPRPYKTGADLPDAKHLNFLFWKQEARHTKGIEVLFPGYRNIELDGQTGSASFVEITRSDGSKDYGYAAVVSGDYTAKTDTPQLMLYAIRTASRTKGTPVSKNELKDMAEKIAASIKRREVK